MVNDDIDDFCPDDLAVQMILSRLLMPVSLTQALWITKPLSPALMPISLMIATTVSVMHLQIKELLVLKHFQSKSGAGVKPKPFATSRNLL